MANFIKINENDNVAVALEVIAAGTTVSVGGTDVTTAMEIPAGHKFALDRKSTRLNSSHM